ncbi:hypothetical protein JD514_20750 [Aeromonas caviae]|uniref:hypothetical protein n=1 Tax=Aeromonas caviae TaxID=648 RepID=UPI00191F95C0|nr:hypothetical protein [Aeromonas caviae]MBL0499473.1 hypothetical protein [Aeromonas caviae]
MVTLKSLGDLSTLDEEASLLSTTRLWEKDIKEITPLLLHTTAKNLKLKNPEKSELITRAIDAIVSEAHKELILGRIESTPIIEFFWPKLSNDVTRFVGIIRRFSGQKRLMVMTAVLTGRHISEVVRLKRTDIKVARSKYEYAVLQKCIPHIHCEYLFWQYSHTSAVPFDGFESEFSRVTNLSWSTFEAMYNNLVEATDDEVQELQALFTHPLDLV